MAGLLLLSGTDVHFKPHDHKVHVFPQKLHIYSVGYRTSLFCWFHLFIWLRKILIVLIPLIQLVTKNPYFAESTYSTGYEKSLFCWIHLFNWLRKILILLIPLIQLVAKNPYFAESTYSTGYEKSLFCWIHLFNWLRKIFILLIPLIQLVAKNPYFAESTYSNAYILILWNPNIRGCSNTRATGYHSVLLQTN